ncbi:aminomethyl transferase family protein [Sphingomonas chungangi]|uniref:aminomethyl transferase family protein n=1 Tax=Sphingomonas chungangi TaxID=2683589 RepID=UPI001C686EC1
MTNIESASPRSAQLRAEEPRSNTANRQSAEGSKHRSLQDLIDDVPSIVEHLFNDAVAPHARPNPERTPVPLEFSNWRDEQRSWRETAVLFDQSHHMPELFIQGPDARALLSRVAINSLDNLAPGRAKQLVGCNARGQLIGDCVLHDLGNERFELISGMPLLNWVHFLAESERLDVAIERDNNTADNPTGGRLQFRFGMDGPHAGDIFAEVVKGEAPDIPFFCTRRVEIAGCQVLALRHGMAGHKGVELSGPYEQRDVVRSAILHAGEKYGIRRGGSRTYFSASIESGWIGYPLPALYTGDDLADFRRWLPADGWEANFQMGGSYFSRDIEDYYLTAYDMGYGGIIKYDHDFIGREALSAIREEQPRAKVTLVWDDEDVSRILDSLMGTELPYKYLDRPVADYVLAQVDEVRSETGDRIGYSTHCCYSINERQQLSLAIVDRAFAEPGTRVTLIWGEADGGSRKSRVERHRQIEVRATVAPVPYAKAASAMKKAAIGKDRG